MKLLFVSLDFPFPADNGHRLRNWGLLRALAAEGHTVTMLTFARPGDPSEEALGRVSEVCTGGVMVEPHDLAKGSGAQSAAQGIRALFAEAPYSILRFRSESMRARLASLLSSNRFDAVMCETCYSVINFPAEAGVPLILDNHNIEHILVRRYARYEPSAARRAYAALEWRRMRAWERASWKRADAVILCSGHDRAECLRLSPMTPAAAVPNIVDVESYSPDPNSDGATLLYVGGMDWFPNRDAVQFFAFQVLPLLRRRFPKVRFVVAGRGPDEQFRSRFDGMDVSFSGTLPDLRPLVAQATVCVVPLRIGSGTRLKILEAAAMGKPVVSTTVGAEGLTFVPDREILMADTAGDFAGAVSRLLADPAARSSMGFAARARVEAEYSLAAMRQSLSAVFNQLQVGQGPSAAREEQFWHSSTC